MAWTTSSQRTTTHGMTSGNLLPFIKQYRKVTAAALPAAAVLAISGHSQFKMEQARETTEIKSKYAA